LKTREVNTQFGRPVGKKKGLCRGDKKKRKERGAGKKMSKLVPGLANAGKKGSPRHKTKNQKGDQKKKQANEDPLI